jgi:hypothetical protein
MNKFLRKELFERSYSGKDVLLLAFAVLYVNLVVNAICSFKGLGYPFNTFLIEPLDRFGDFFKVMDGLGIADTWDGFNESFIYYEHLLPVSSTIYLGFAKLINFTGGKYFVLLGFYVSCLYCIYAISKKQGNHRQIFFFTLASYPVLFSMDRGNLAILVFTLLFFALTTKNILFSTLAIALATSIKLTPIIFLVPLVLDRPLTLKWVIQVASLFFNWLILVNSIAIITNGIFLTPSVIDPFVLFGGPLRSYSQNHINTLVGLIYGSSLYMPTLYLTNKFNFLPEIKSYELVIIICGIIGLCLLAKGTIVKTYNKLLDKRNFIFLSSICFVLFMPVTGDYYLLILLIPLLSFPQTQYSFGYFLVFGLLLGAKNFLFINHTEFIGNSLIPWQAFINPILLLILFIGEFDLLNIIKRDQSLDTVNVRITKPIHFFLKLSGILNPIFISTSRGFGTVYINTFNFINRIFIWSKDAVYLQKKKIAIVFALIILGWFGNVQISKYQAKVHNIETGLPPDFDPKKYLELNPGLEKFWISKGIKHTSKKALLEHAEIHYRDFGAKDNWQYK